MWTQTYDPLGSWPALDPRGGPAGAGAARPAGLGQGERPGPSALAGLVTAAAAAVVRLRDAGRHGRAGRGRHGVVFAAFRIVWLIVAAVFLYDIAVATGQFDVMKASIARLSGDRRLQAVLVAFSFGAFIEGAAGFGAPVAISAAFLVGLGFRPFQAALLCLIANTAPVAWGAIGTPILTLAEVTGLDVEALSATSGRILPPLVADHPVLAGPDDGLLARDLRRLAGPAGRSAGRSPVTQFVWSNFVGFELVDIVSAVASLLAGVVLLQLWRPKDGVAVRATTTASRGDRDSVAVDLDDRPRRPGLDAVRCCSR